MYDRASRNLSKPLNNTLETVGPGSYEQPSSRQEQRYFIDQIISLNDQWSWLALVGRTALNLLWKISIFQSDIKNRVLHNYYAQITESSSYSIASFLKKKNIQFDNCKYIHYKPSTFLYLSRFQIILVCISAFK